MRSARTTRFFVRVRLAAGAWTRLCGVMREQEQQQQATSERERESQDTYIQKRQNLDSIKQDV
jgi:hypothetical protein